MLFNPRPADHARRSEQCGTRLYINPDLLFAFCIAVFLACSGFAQTPSQNKKPAEELTEELTDEELTDTECLQLMNAIDSLISQEEYSQAETIMRNLVGREMVLHKPFVRYAAMQRLAYVQIKRRHYSEAREVQQRVLAIENELKLPDDNIAKTKDLIQKLEKIISTNALSTCVEEIEKPLQDKQ